MASRSFYPYYPYYYQERGHKVAEEKSTAGELMTLASTITFILVVAVLVVLNFMFGWDNFWGIIWTSVGVGIILFLLGVSINAWVAAIRRARSTRVGK